jgi:predicted nucleic acid-binding protein
MALPARLFCDTSLFYACFDQHDVNHERAKQLSEEAATVGSALYVTWISSVKQRRSFATGEPTAKR